MIWIIAILFICLIIQEVQIIFINRYLDDISLVVDAILNNKITVIDIDDDENGE